MQVEELHLTSTLLPCLERLAALQNVVIDKLALQEAIETESADERPNIVLQLVIRELHLKPVKWVKLPDPAQMPALFFSPQNGWGILRGQNSQGQWIVEKRDQVSCQWEEIIEDSLTENSYAIVHLSRPFTASNSPVYQLISAEVFSHKRLLFEAVLAGVVVNIVALATSFYSMQVYDRVVPTGASQTLMVLSLGVFIAIFYDFITKKVRTKIFDKLVDRVDQRLARRVYMRFLNVRMDQLPQSIGGLASQMRGYETVRSFLSSVTARLLIDVPFALIFVLVIGMIAGPIAFIPLVFFVICIFVGLYFRNRVDALAGSANHANNFKMGLLVESVEGAETIKSGQGGWRMLARWMSNTDEARSYEIEMRNLSEHSQHLAAAFQQISYILVVASGAMLISRGDLTMGGLIACTILSGRVLAPVASIPSQLVQWAHTKAALRGLDALWQLQDDHHGQEQPVVLKHLHGGYQFEAVEAKYGESPGLQVPNLIISPGEKVGVLGPIGAGKTTLLRLLSGMYKPQSGRILLDDVDLAHISKPVLAENMGYVQQEGRLFAGTLRENLILGLLDPGDEVIMEVARLTGLLSSVIATSSQGLQRPIFEGGAGLSGGQRQLVNLTRAFLRRPNIWLLDEPTASMDRPLEQQIIEALKRSIKPEHTLVLVTHKQEMLNLVDRIVVIASNRVVMDGAKEDILRRLYDSKNTQQRKLQNAV